MTESRYEGYKEGFKDGFREGLRAKSENDIREELKKELEEEVRRELRDELIDEVKEELREELREECKEGYLKEYLDDFKKGFIEGFPKGVRKGELKALRQVVQDGVVSISDAAKFAGTTEDELRKELGLVPEEPSDATPEEAPDKGASKGDVQTEDSTFDEQGDVFGEEETDEDNDGDEDEEEVDYFDIEPVGTRARLIGIGEGRVKVLKQLVIDGVLTLAEAAESVCMTIPEFELEAVRTEEQWATEYESIWSLIGNKDELLSSQPKLEAIVENAIAEWRETGVLEGAAILLEALVARGVLTKVDERRYIDELR